VTAIWNNPATPNGPAQGNSQQQGPGRPGQPQPGDGQSQQNQQGQQAQQARPMGGGPVGQATAIAEAKADQTAEKQEQDGQPEAAEDAVKAEVEAKDASEADDATEDAADSDQANDAPKAEKAKVTGQIEIADEVVEKVSALAALEVEGVVDLGGDVARLLENVRERIGVGQKRGDQGVKASITGGEVTINLTIVVEYGHVVMDVARNVQSNVAQQANKMLGLRVAEVNVKVDDVQLPQAATAGRRRDDSAASGEGAAE
jgi:uncharacterized alkaline shock family protein YloU